MATYIINITESTGSGSGSIYSRLALSSINSLVRANIPKYAIINSVTMKYYAMETTNKVGKADLYIFFGDDSNNSKYQLYYGDGVIPKNSSEYHEVTLDLKNYVTSGNSSAGNMSYSGATYLTARFQSALVSRTYKRYGNITFDFTHPAIRISTIAENGGVVSESVSVGVTTEDANRTIIAVPNTGYKFVKWVCSDGTVYEGENYATLSVPVTQDRLTSSNTTITYTAYFEQLPPPEFTSVEMKYLDKQISNTNKVIAGESLVISVGVT